jgi:hypothetical protein
MGNLLEACRKRRRKMQRNIHKGSAILILQHIFPLVGTVGPKTFLY